MGDYPPYNYPPIMGLDSVMILGPTIGAIIIPIGFGGVVRYNYGKELLSGIVLNRLAALTHGSWKMNSVISITPSSVSLILKTELL